MRRIERSGWRICNSWTIPSEGERPMSEPTIAQKSPYPVEVEAGKSYFWCACGKSAKQPFCDGSHKGTDFTPVKFDATEDKTVYFCGCKHTKNPPLCDGSHAKL
jgi:CDGSH-type Zn-finger protein